MTVSTKSYSAAEWEISAFGFKVNDGIVKGTHFKVTRNEAMASVEVGGDGSPVIVRNLNKSGKLELTLQRSSPVNRRLSTVAAAFEAGLTPGAGIGDMMVRNVNQPLTKAKSTYAVIEKWPDMEGADTASPCVWVILLTDASMFHDGSVA